MDRTQMDYTANRKPASKVNSTSPDACQQQVLGPYRLSTLVEYFPEPRRMCYSIWVAWKIAQQPHYNPVATNVQVEFG